MNNSSAIRRVVSVDDDQVSEGIRVHVVGAHEMPVGGKVSLHPGSRVNLHDEARFSAAGIHYEYSPVGMDGNIKGVNKELTGRYESLIGANIWIAHIDADHAGSEFIN